LLRASLKRQFDWQWVVQGSPLKRPPRYPDLEVNSDHSGNDAREWRVPGVLSHEPLL
jgi:hypothetical protein